MPKPGQVNDGHYDEPADTAHLHWVKITDPDAVPPDHPPYVDVRVLLPADERFSALREKLLADDVAVREVGYLVERDTISTVERDGQLSATCGECYLARPNPRWFPATTGHPAQIARDAFDLVWQSHTPLDNAHTEPVPVEQVVPADWVRYLPHSTVNPAQAQAIPYVLDSDDHLIVVAPTGAGKTVIGMVAALRTVLERGQKAAWLVPQRSLTDELNEELDSWRQRGLRVERLSGEYRVDVQRVRDADLWVATTEKFESICRASSLREALAEVGCLIVDEIHLLGDEARGSILEALLARVKGTDFPMRIVGLSATVANAEQIAAWLHARLVRIAWRPTRLTWQLPVVASNRDWGLVEAARTRLTSSISNMVTSRDGSVLVFCGSKRNVRRTALVIAAGRGADVHGVHPDDLERLHQVCHSVGVGLHYKGWEHKRDAERAFRARELRVLVATSTVAAGVNLPARAVIVQDTQVGLNTIDVATVQQMFGRAGRVGAGEDQGWAFLIVDESERTAWQSKLIAGHRVDSQILSSLADHVLAEAAQGRITSMAQAEGWWVQTLAHHQGNRSVAPLRQAVDFLVAGDFLAQTTTSDGDVELVPTDLGLLTARIMVPTLVCHRLRTALAEAELPTSADAAEALIVAVLSTVVPKLAQASISEDAKSAVIQLLLAGGHVSAFDGPADPADHSRAGGAAVYQPGDLAQAVLLAVANSPTEFHRGARQINGISYAAMYPILEEAPRFLHWLAGQGFLGTVHPWIAIVAADLGKRVRWRRCQPRRGAGRLLWMCEQMATSVHLDDVVPLLWEAATARGVSSPDWSATGRPRHCQLDQRDYAALMKDRITGCVLEREAGQVLLTSPTTTTLAVWTDGGYVTASTQRGKAALPDQATTTSSGVAAFTWRGDYFGTGWLQTYSHTTAAGEPSTHT